MRVPQMPIGLCHHHAPVFMSDPCSDGFEIDMLLDGHGDEEVTHAVVVILRQTLLFATSQMPYLDMIHYLSLILACLAS